MHNIQPNKQSSLKSTVKTISNLLYTTINGVVVSMSTAKDYDNK